MSHLAARHGRLTLYVGAGPQAAADRRALAAAARAAPTYRRAGIVFHVARVRPKDMRNRRVIAAFAARGVTRLPAVLVTGRPPIVGAAAIAAHFAMAASALSEREVQAAVEAELRGRNRSRGPGRGPPAGRQRAIAAMREDLDRGRSGVDDSFDNDGGEHGEGDTHRDGGHASSSRDDGGRSTDTREQEDSVGLDGEEALRSYYEEEMAVGGGDDDD